MRASFVLLGCLSAVSVQAQLPVTCPAANQYCGDVMRLRADARVRNALNWIAQNDAAGLRELIELTQIPAPPFKEEVRGRRFAELLRSAGADSVWTDSIGNVLGLRRGTRRQSVLALGGHLDTVFPEGTDVRVEQRGDTLFAPGIADDTRGLVAMLQVLRALRVANLRTQNDLLFIGTVGEEGLGDLRGMKYLFRAGGPRIDAFIAVDGTEDDEVTHQGLGSRRYRITFKGPGGHSWSDFGRANPLHALGRAIHLFDEAAAAFTARGERTSYNFGRTGGGTSVNSIPFDAWVEVDMRSESQRRLLQIDSILRTTVAAALEQQNLFVREAPPLTVSVQLVGDRPSGETPAHAPIVQRASAVTLHLGMTPRLTRSSTDANIPIARGIPAITIGSGGISANAHAPNEWFINRAGVRGIQRILLLTLAEAGT
jgi:acetylornithine deacetylase/succinyl-diaminopimelate desuccinylase-like protein